MAKATGQFAFSGNFDVQAAAPIDTRVTVETVADLTNAEVWKAPDGGVYLYKGLTVSVQETGDVYVLTDYSYDASNTDNPFTSTWSKVGSEPTVWDSEDLGWPTTTD